MQVEADSQEGKNSGTEKNKTNTTFIPSKHSTPNDADDTGRKTNTGKFQGMKDETSSTKNKPSDKFRNMENPFAGDLSRETVSAEKCVPTAKGSSKEQKDVNKTSPSAAKKTGTEVDSTLKTSNQGYDADPKPRKPKKHKRRRKVSDKDRKGEEAVSLVNSGTSSDGADSETSKTSAEANDCDKDAETKDNIRKKKSDDSFVDPLSVDLYDRLRAERGDKSGKDPWENFICDDLQKACKTLSCSNKMFYMVLISIFLAMTVAMLIGLLILHSQLSLMAAHELVKVQAPRKEIPPGQFDLYFDYLELDEASDKVDLRVNTTIFVH